MPPDLIIFDCDGVLIDSELIACRTDAACLAEIGLPITAEEIAAGAGPRLALIFKGRQ